MTRRWPSWCAFCFSEINAGIERQIRQLGGRAVGPHLGSLQLLFGEKLLLPGPDGQPIDLGRVGKVTQVDVDLIARFLRGRRRPGDSVAWRIDDGGQLAERQRRHRRRRRRRPDCRPKSWCC